MARPAVPAGHGRAWRGQRLRIIRRDDEHFNGVHHHVLEIAPPDGLPSYRLYVDAVSALSAKRRFSQGGQEVDNVFSDFRTHARVRLPWRIQSLQEGRLAEDIAYTAMRLDAPVDELLFAPIGR